MMQTSKLRQGVVTNNAEIDYATNINAHAPPCNNNYKLNKDNFQVIANKPINFDLLKHNSKGNDKNSL